MKTRILLILFLTGCVLTDKSVRNSPDMSCMVIHLEYTECLWKTKVNYTFYSRFYHNDFQECESYVVEDGVNVGCWQPEENLKIQRFFTFYTKLKHGDEVFTKEHQLKNRVKLNPPTNLTVQYETVDSNLWFKWRQILKNCVESEVRYRVNNNNWDTSRVGAGREDYCINLPSNDSRYELQVRSRVSDACGQSIEWSDWSEPVVWGSNNSTDVNCMLTHLEYIECLWKTKRSPFVSYTFYSRFHYEEFEECESYVVEDGVNVGCRQPKENLKLVRFHTFYTKLKHGDEVFTKEHQLKNRVKLNPPTNLTVQYESDSNLWFKWRQILKKCVESEVRYRVNNNNWDMSRVGAGQEDYCINLPSNNSRYELQVRSRVSDACGQSIEWSNWSEPVVWGSNNSTG